MRKKYLIKRHGYKKLMEEDKMYHIHVNSDHLARLGQEMQDDNDDQPNMITCDLARYLFSNLGFKNHERIRDMLMLYYVSGHSAINIAEQYGVSANYIHQVIKKVRPELASRVKKQGIDLTALLSQN